MARVLRTDLPPGVAHAGTVGPAAGRHHEDSAGGAGQAHQPKVVLRVVGVTLQYTGIRRLGGSLGLPG